ncbi:hypothetical protein C3L33_16124, partial [Rhododendron williamsianum]
MEEIRNSIKVCVTGGSGYIASWLVKKLLERGYTTHATLRNLDDKIKVGLLESLPYADTRLVLFQADIYNPTEFGPPIEGCHYVFHVATPLQHNTQSSKYKDTTEAAIAGVKSIADCCVRSQTVKRLIYTASVMSLSPLREDGNGYKPSFNESCWTPLNFSFTFGEGYALAYTNSKTLAEKQVLSYNETEDGKLEVVSLACGVVGGDNTLLNSQLPLSVAVLLSQITGNLPFFNNLKFLQELLGSIPLVHIDDVCEAHIFCLEKESIGGRFMFKEGPEKRSSCDNTKLMEMGFHYKNGVKDILNGCVDFGRRLQAFSSN